MCNFLPTMAVLRGSWASPVLGPGGRGPIGVWVFFGGDGGQIYARNLRSPPPHPTRPLSSAGRAGARPALRLAGGRAAGGSYWLATGARSVAFRLPLCEAGPGPGLRPPWRP